MSNLNSPIKEPCSISQLDAGREEENVDFSYPAIAADLHREATSRNPIPISSSPWESLMDQLRDLKESCLPPLTLDSIQRYYLPVQGAISYHVIGVGVLNPRLIRNILASVGIRRDFTSIFAGSSILGFGSYLAFRPEGRAIFRGNKVGEGNRLGYSLFISTFSVFGSVLLWALAARNIPTQPLFRLGVALGSASGLIAIKSRIVNQIGNMGGE